MTTDLTDDLRAAFEQRAAEIPAADPPGVVYGYRTTRPSHRLPLAVVGGAVAAGLLTLAFVRGGDDATSTRTTLTRSSSTVVPSQVTPEPHDGAFVTGVVDGHPWALVSTRTPAGGDDVHLEADGMEDAFHDQYTVLRGTVDPTRDDQRFLFVQIGPCCRLAGHTMLVGVFAPDVLRATVTPDGGDPIEATTTPSPGATDGYRYLVVPVPPGHDSVRIEAHRADGTTALVGDGNWELDLTTIGG
jgi:hypothetical protein